MRVFWRSKVNIPSPSRSLDGAVLAIPLLLVSFLLIFGSHFPGVAGLAVELPAGFPSLVEPRGADVAIAVKGFGSYVCGDLLLDGAGLAEVLEKSSSKGTALFLCDRRMPLEDLLRAAEIAKMSGFGTIQIAIAP